MTTTYTLEQWEKHLPDNMQETLAFAAKLRKETAPEIAQWLDTNYRRLNVEKFAGALPIPTLVAARIEGVWGVTNNVKNTGQVVLVGVDDRLITVFPDIAEDTLLHEMTHVLDIIKPRTPEEWQYKTWDDMMQQLIGGDPGHDDVWFAEYKKRGGKGARWLEPADSEPVYSRYEALGLLDHTEVPLLNDLRAALTKQSPGGKLVA